MAHFKKTKKNLFIINALIFINILIIADGGFMTPLWSNFVISIGGNLETAGQAVLVFSMAIGVFMWVAGTIEHRCQNDEWFMCFSSLIVFLSYLGYFFVHHPWQLYLVQIGLGIGGAFQTPVICAIYQRHFKQKDSSLYWAIWNGFFNIALGIGAVSSAFLVSHFSYQVMFSTLAGTAGTVMVLTTLLMMHMRKASLIQIWTLKKREI